MVEGNGAIAPPRALARPREVDLREVVNAILFPSDEQRVVAKRTPRALRARIRLFAATISRQFLIDQPKPRLRRPSCRTIQGAWVLWRPRLQA